MQRIPLTFEQKMTYNLLLKDVSELSSFPTIPTPPEVISLGLTLNEMFKNNKLKTMYLDKNGKIVVY